MPTLQVEERAWTVGIRVRVKTRAAKTRILGIREGALEVAVAAPPVDAEANFELIRVLGTALDRGKSAIEIVSGGGSRSKLLSLAGFTADELRANLNR